MTGQRVLQRWRLAQRVGVAALLVVASVAAGVMPAGAQGLSVSVSETAGLIDGQLIEVSWSPDEIVGLSLCSDDSCIQLTEPHAWEFQPVSTNPIEVAVPAAFRVESGAPLIDCRIDACELRLSESGTFHTVPLEFDQAAPLLPDPELTVTPATGLVDGQIVDASVPGPWGFVTAELCTTNGGCLSDLNEPYNLRNDHSLPVRSAANGYVCETEGCVVQAELRHPRVFEGATPISFVPGTQPVTDPKLTFDGPVAPGQQVTIVGSGFLPDVAFELVTCQFDECTGGYDGYGGLNLTDASGAFSVPVTACALNGTCEVRVWAYGDSATTLLFAAEGAEAFCDPVYDTKVDEAIAYRVAEDVNGDDIELLLDAYTPVDDDPGTLRPAVLWMHGGYFEFGSRGTADFANIAASSGMVAFSIDYRKRPRNGALYPSDEAVDDTYEDAAAAVEWIIDHAEEYRIDTRAIVVAGFSAGAITALNLAYWDRTVDGFNPSEHVAVAIADAGLLWPGGAGDAEDPPSVMAHGLDDSIVPVAAAEFTCQEINRLGSYCEIDVQEGGHGRNSPELWALAQPFMAQHGLGELGYCERDYVEGPRTPTTTTTPTSTTPTSTSPPGRSGPSSANDPSVTNPLAGMPPSASRPAAPLAPRFTG